MLLARPLLISFNAAITAMRSPSRHHQNSLVLNLNLRFQFSRAGQTFFYTVNSAGHATPLHFDGDSAAGADVKSFSAAITAPAHK
eukprot:8753004-Karenia_brevis.AAC.1